uniref:Uncharacterized protein n=2 Tax=Triticum urartu TaxID=4572 RepID=A0A8R7U569_TRIUA
MYYYWECSEIRTQRSIDSTITVYSRSRVLLLHHLVSSVQQKPQNQFRSREIVSLVGLGIMNGFSSISHSGQVPDVVSDGSTRMSGRQIVQVGRNPMPLCLLMHKCTFSACSSVRQVLPATMPAYVFLV